MSVVPWKTTTYHAESKQGASRKSAEPQAGGRRDGKHGGGVGPALDAAIASVLASHCGASRPQWLGFSGQWGGSGWNQLPSSAVVPSAPAAEQRRQKLGSGWKNSTSEIEQIPHCAWKFPPSN